MFGSLDPAKLLVVLVIALIVFGPERLPKIARQLGGAWHELQKLREQAESELRSALPDLSDLPKLPGSPSSAVHSFLSDLTRPVTTATATAREQLRSAIEPLSAGGAAAVAAGQAPAAGTQLSAERPVEPLAATSANLGGTTGPSTAFVQGVGAVRLATSSGDDASFAPTSDLAGFLDDPSMN
jgi:sec-independent protein translocase protein TatB